MRWPVALLFFALFGVAGSMERHDQEAVEEFRHDWMVVTDESGEPRLVAVGGKRRDKDAVRDLQEVVQVRAPR